MKSEVPGGYFKMIREIAPVTSSSQPEMQSAYFE